MARSDKSTVRRLFRGVLLGLFLSAALTGVAEAQRGGGGGQNPQPQPPQPQPRPQPQPSRSPLDRLITVRGRVFTDTPQLPTDPIQIRLEGQAFEFKELTITDNYGNFQFNNINLEGIYYVVVDHEGFEPFRERLDRVLFGQSMDIHLRAPVVVRRENPARGAGDNPLLVDLGQLQVDIPDDAVDAFEEGIEEARDGNYERAVEHLEEAVEIAPDYYDAQNSLGIQYLRLERYREAEAAFERSMALNPSGAEPLMNLGSLYYQEGETQERAEQAEEASATFSRSVERLEEALRLNPFSAPANHRLGAALYKTQSYDRAEEALQRAMELDPEMDESLLVLINVYTRGRRYHDALDALVTYVDRNPEDPQRPALERIKEQIEGVLAQQP